MSPTDYDTLKIILQLAINSNVKISICMTAKGEHKIKFSSNFPFNWVKARPTIAQERHIKSLVASKSTREKN